MSDQQEPATLPTTEDLAESVRLAIKVIADYLATPVNTDNVPDDRVRAEFALKIIDFVMG